MTDYHKLPLCGFHWGMYRVETRGGRVHALHPFEEDRDPSPIGPGIVDVVDGPTRVTRPMFRRGWLERGPGADGQARGQDRFVALDWDEAEQRVADELDRVRRLHGNEAIYAGSYGWASAGRFHHAQSQLHRFLNCLGGYTRSVDTYSFAAAEVILPHVLGDFWGLLFGATSWPSIIAERGLVVAFGGLPLKNGQINAGGVGNHCQRDSIAAAAAAGVEFVNVSPLAGDLDADGVEWLAPRPCTDTAILLGIAHTLLVEGRHDREFLARYCVGFERFADYLRGAADGSEKSAEWAAAISDLPAERIRALARRMAARRTMISLSWSLTRQDFGEQPIWAGIALAAMLGQIGLPGGGFGFGYSAVNSIGLHYSKLLGAALPQGERPVESFIPVARISDMLLHPGGRFDYNGGRYRYPDIRLVYWAGGNPFHHHQDLNRLHRAWQKPETVIVNDWCWNASAKRADIVLPCTTPLERDDIVFSPRDPYLVYSARARDPVGESRDDYDIFRGIADRLGVGQAFSEGRDTQDWLHWFHDIIRRRNAEAGHEVPDFDCLRERRWHKVDDPPRPTVLLEAFRRDPAANPLQTPSGKIEIFSATVDGFGYRDCRGHPAWYEPGEWLGGDRSRFGLHLLCHQPPTKLHSQLDHGAVSRAAKIGGREPVRMHPRDAAVRGIADGQLVRIHNDRGALLAAAVLGDDIRPGVALIATGAWYDPDGADPRLCKHGNPNLVTPDHGTSSLAQGPAAHACLVEIEPFTGAAPPISAYDPPPIEPPG